MVAMNRALLRLLRLRPIPSSYVEAGWGWRTFCGAIVSCAAFPSSPFPSSAHRANSDSALSDTGASFATSPPKRGTRLFCHPDDGSVSDGRNGSRTASRERSRFRFLKIAQRSSAEAVTRASGFSSDKLAARFQARRGVNFSALPRSILRATCAVWTTVSSLHIRHRRPKTTAPCLRKNNFWRNEPIDGGMPIIRPRHMV